MPTIKPRLRKLTQAEKAQVLEQWTPLCWKLAKQFANTWPGCRVTTEDDLFNEAAISLLTAAELFDPGLGVKFITYATTAISRKLRRVVDTGGVVHFSAHVTESRGGKPPAGLPRVYQFREKPGGGGAEEDLEFAEDRGDVREGEGIPCPRTEAMLAAFWELPERERHVIARRYAFDGPEASFAEIGREIGVSWLQVKRSEVGAMIQLMRRSRARLRKGG